MKRYGLIGYPLAHSYSSRFFNEKFKQENIDAQYVNFEMKRVEELRLLVTSDPELRGLNVTTPHKEAVIPLMDELSEEAEAVRAVNTIDIRDGRMKGYNTDIHGFRQSIKPFLTKDHERALILGTGGAARAVAHVLRKIGLRVLFASRHPQDPRQVAYDAINDYMIRSHLLIVNCTPLGTYPQIHDKPDIPYQYLTENHLLYDLVYNPSETAFMKEGIVNGATVMNGIGMLHAQAMKSWEIWNS